MGNSDYNKAKKLGLTSIDRWGTGVSHHKMSERLMEFLADHDLEDYGDYFCWKMGGDGDNGEALMYEMDAFFEMLDSRAVKEAEGGNMRLEVKQDSVALYDDDALQVAWGNDAIVEYIKRLKGELRGVRALLKSEVDKAYILQADNVVLGKVREERDRARREVCNEIEMAYFPRKPITKEDVAIQRGWDCFAEPEKKKE